MVTEYDRKKIIGSYSDLVEYLELGCKPQSAWRIGTEHEKFGYSKANFLPLPYSGKCSIESILNGLRDKYGWSELLEGNRLIGLSKKGAKVSLEPGGQLELSGALLNTVHETCSEVSQHLDEVKDIGNELGAGFFAFGAAPEWTHSEMPSMPKGRYQLMSSYMDSVGSHGKVMMYRTCTVQVNLDFSCERDMVKKMRVALALQPVVTAMFASSPFFEGKISGYQSWRARVWQDTDPSRTGMLPFVFDKGFGFQSWVDFALDVPMYFVYRNGSYINALGQSFKDFLRGQLPALPGEKPSLEDWENHLTTIFPEVRLKQFIEMRGADAGPADKICALPAFWVGILYNSGSLDAAWDICKNWSENEREKLRMDVAKDGLRALIGGRRVLDLAEELVDLSEVGLQQRGHLVSKASTITESIFLEKLKEILDTRKSMSDELLEKYFGSWNKNLNHLYESYSF